MARCHGSLLSSCASSSAQGKTVIDFTLYTQGAGLRKKNNDTKDTQEMRAHKHEYMKTVPPNTTIVRVRSLLRWFPPYLVSDYQHVRFRINSHEFDELPVLFSCRIQVGYGAPLEQSTLVYSQHIQMFESV